MTAPKDVTGLMVEEHRLILRMITVLERRVAQVEGGGYTDWGFFLDAVDFIRNYADRFHHGKEEDVLFTALIANGMPKENSPVAAMLQTHEEGRAHVRVLEAEAQKAIAGDLGGVRALIKAGKGYAALLRNHIQIEDEVLYPLSERLLPAEKRDAMIAAYAAQEAASPELTAKYRALVERYEGPRRG